MTEPYKIEKNVPLPKANIGRKIIFRFSEMQIGDSFVCPRNKLSGLSSNAKRVGVKIAYRTLEDVVTIRVWRIE